MPREYTDPEFDPDDSDDVEGRFAEEFDEGHDADDESPERGGGATATAYCPDCGAEIYDAAEICPRCFAWIDGDTLRKSPRRQRANDRWTKLVVWALIAAIATGLGVFSLLEAVR